MRTIACMLAWLAVQDPVTFEKELAPVAKLVGRFEGAGESLMGPYRETIEAEWNLDRTLITLRSKSTMGEMVVFEDLRVFSYDAAKKRIRCRQFAMGTVTTYDVAVKDDGKTLVLSEVESEGGKRNEWRYTVSLRDDGFSYQLDTKEKGEFRKYVKGELKRE